MNKTIFVVIVAIVGTAAVVVNAGYDRELNALLRAERLVDNTDNNSTTTTIAPTDSMKCKMCINFVQGLEAAVQSEEGTMEEIANKLCDKLTQDESTLEEMCKEMVDESLKEISDAIKNFEPPRKICTAIVPLC
uniref:Saposin B-type domain-containing protein n=1 Tax=Panagrolaimus sp. ES5 TaxID=591445 RepID=A0AC34FLN1_9BILA